MMALGWVTYELYLDSLKIIHVEPTSEFGGNYLKTIMYGYIHYHWKVWCQKILDNIK